MEENKDLQGQIVEKAAEVVTENVNATLEAKADSTSVEEVKAAMESKADATAVEELKAENITLQKSIDDLKTEFKSINITKSNKMENNIVKEFLADNAKTIKEGGKVSLELKDFTGSAGAASAPYGDERVGEIKYDPNYQNRLRNNLVTGSTSQSGAIRFSRETAETDSSAGKQKGAAQTQSAVTLTDSHKPIVTVFNLLTLPQEWLDDVAMIESYLSTRLMGNLLDVEDQYLISGDDSATQFEGLNTGGVAKSEAAFDTFFGGLANQYGTGANHYDVLTAAKAGLANTNFMGDLAILNPIDAARLATLKASTNEYVLHQTVSPNGQISQFWNGMKIVESPAQAAGTFTVLDKSCAQYWMREGQSIEFGMNAGDFGSNNISVRAVSRGAQTIYKPAGIVTGTFANAIASLNA